MHIQQIHMVKKEVGFHLASMYKSVDMCHQVSSRYTDRVLPAGENSM